MDVYSPFLALKLRFFVWLCGGVPLPIAPPPGLPSPPQIPDTHSHARTLTHSHTHTHTHTHAHTRSAVFTWEAGWREKERGAESRPDPGTAERPRGPWSGRGRRPRAEETRAGGSGRGAARRGSVGPLGRQPSSLGSPGTGAAHCPRRGRPPGLLCVPSGRSSARLLSGSEAGAGAWKGEGGEDPATASLKDGAGLGGRPGLRDLQARERANNGAAEAIAAGWSPRAALRVLGVGAGAAGRSAEVRSGRSRCPGLPPPLPDSGRRCRHFQRPAAPPSSSQSQLDWGC
ncbi:translation initiation factor IF-2-like isoform X2 [Antechinus flavipes]|uniref:translation initiation factor IF-2-like isoform X2 n=1 Tax=Antechinus flavipes TaxID=38775 RepID=UPI00223633CC|nr:translation initiation factor IF-2-like isoform X2 [Antechinus flavipes]